LADLVLGELVEATAGVGDAAGHDGRIAVAVELLRNPRPGPGLPVGMADCLIPVHGGAQAGEFGLLVAVLPLPAGALITAGLQVVRVRAREASEADARARAVLHEVARERVRHGG